MDSTSFDNPHVVRPGEIVFEIDEERHSVYESPIFDESDRTSIQGFGVNRRIVLAGNSHQHFFPVPSRQFDINYVRSRIVLKREGPRISRTLDAALDDIEYVPGERIHVDLVNRVGRITDALADPDNEALYRKVVSAGMKMQHRTGQVWRIGEYIEVNLRDDASLWSWIFWMRRIADGDTAHNGGPERHPGCALEGPRLCRPVQNIDALPTYEECVDSGKVPMHMNGEDTTFMQQFVKERQENDPDYKRVSSGRATLTRYIAGLQPVGAE